MTASAQVQTITYREVISQLESAYDLGGSPSISSSISSREILRDFHQVRSLIIHRDFKVMPNAMYRDLYQTLHCLPLTEEGINECPCIPPSGCVWKRTAVQLPTMIGNPIAVVSSGGTLTQIRHYDYIDWFSYEWTQYDRFSDVKEKAYYTIRNKFIYLIPGTEDDEKFLAVTAIYDDPMKVMEFPDCEGNANICVSPLDQQIIMDPARLDELMRMITQLQLSKRGVAPYDNSIDENPAAGIEGRPQA